MPHTPDEKSVTGARRAFSIALSLAVTAVFGFIAWYYIDWHAFVAAYTRISLYLPGNDLFPWAGVPPSRDAVIWNNVPIVLKQQFDGNHLKYKSIWLVWSSKRSAPEPAAELLKTTHKQISEKTYRGLTIRRYDAPD